MPNVYVITKMTPVNPKPSDPEPKGNIMHKLPEPLYRALRTFIQGAVGVGSLAFYQMWSAYVSTHVWDWSAMWWIVLAPAIMAGMAALMNLPKPKV